MIVLRRKRPFCRERQPIQRTAPTPYYWDRDPKLDYLPYLAAYTTPEAWIAQNRSNIARQLVIIKQLNSARIIDIKQLTAITHPNIAKPLSFYRSNDRLYVVHHFLHLDVLDLLPLLVWEISSIMKQFITGLQYMINSGVMFCIDVVRIGLDGVIKIVLDWNLESDVVEGVKAANQAYILAYLQDMMSLMVESSVDVPGSAHDLIHSKTLPNIDEHPFLIRAGGPSVLREVVEYASQKKFLT